MSSAPHSGSGLPRIPEEKEEVAIGRIVLATVPHDDGRVAHPDPRAPGPWMGGFAYPWCTLASLCVHALQCVYDNGLPARALRVVTENQGGCGKTGWMECEAGDLLYCPYGSVWNGSQSVTLAFKYITGHSRLKFTEHGYVKDTVTADQLPGSATREDRLRRISELTGNIPSEGSPSTTVRTHRLWQSPSSDKWTTIKTAIVELLAMRPWNEPMTRGHRPTKDLVPGLMCAVNDTPRQGRLMGLTMGDNIVVLAGKQQGVQIDAGTTMTVVKCCKYWLGASAQSGAIKDYGFCRLSDLEPQREGDHYDALYNALHVTGSRMGSWDWASQNGT